MQILNKKILPDGLMEMEIEISDKEIGEFIKDTIKSITINEKFSGFRPGKVPIARIKQKYNDMDLLQKSLDKIISVTYYETLMKEKVLAIGPPEIEVVKMAPNNPLIYKAKITVLPKVKIADYHKIKVKKEKTKVSEEKKAKLLKNLQRSRAKETIADRPAQKEDKILLDIEMSIDRVPLENGSAKNTAIVLGDELYLPGLDEQIIDMKAGEKKEFTLPYPENHYDKNLAGKRVDFKVKINAIYQMELPELNDGFAKSLGKFENLADLKDKISKNLTAEVEEREEQRLEQEIFDKLIEASEFDPIPQPLIENEKDVMIKEMEGFIKSQGLKFDDYLSHLQKNPAELKKGLEPQATKRLKTSLLIREVVKQENIKGTDQEIEEKINGILKYDSSEETKKRVADKKYKDYLYNAIVSRKAVEILKEKMAVED